LRHQNAVAYLLPTQARHRQVQHGVVAVAAFQSEGGITAIDGIRATKYQHIGGRCGDDPACAGLAGLLFNHMLQSGSPARAWRGVKGVVQLKVGELLAWHRVQTQNASKIREIEECGVAIDLCLVHASPQLERCLFGGADAV
jgi:hypothetical protein